jgi:hypothetical protein
MTCHNKARKDLTSSLCHVSYSFIFILFICLEENEFNIRINRLCGLVFRVPGYRTEMYCFL